MSAEKIILLISAVLIISAMMTKVCFKIGMPTLIMFLSLGMVIGSDGIVGLRFDNPTIAMFIGIFALSFITFNGGITTDWATARPVLTRSLLLASVGVIITAILTGLFAVYFLGFSVSEGLLLGAIVSSTDAAATFSILRSNGVRLKNNLGTLLEFESGSNDPFSYILTTVMITVVVSAGSLQSQAVVAVWALTKQVAIGAAFGLIMGYLVPKFIDKVKLDYESLYPMFTMAIAFLIFSAASLIDGNGLLAIYVAGLMIGNKSFVHKKSLLRFFEGQTWIMQVLLFVMLGLLVYPKELPSVAVEGVSVALFILFVARPIAVFGILSFFKMSWKEMLFISIAGIRGAASMVFAILPLMAGLAIGPRIFNIVFFIAIVSVLLQGGLITRVARWLDLTEAHSDIIKLKDFSSYIDEMEDCLMDVEVAKNSESDGKYLKELGLPDNIRIIRIKRDGKSLHVHGNVQIHQGDHLLLITSDFYGVDEVRHIFEMQQLPQST